MKNKILIIAGLFIAISMQRLHAQSAGNFLYNNPYSVNKENVNINLNNNNGSNVNLLAQVMMNVRATSYTAIFAITQSGMDVMQVDSMMHQRIAQVMYALNRMGIAEEDIHIDAVAMVPTYAQKIEEKKFSKRATEIPTGFEMKKNIHVLFKNHDLLDGIISEMAFADIYDLVKVEYNIDGVQSYYDQLRQAALSVIQTKEATYKALNLHLDIFTMADGFNTTYPLERYKSYTAYNSGASIQAVNYALTQQNYYQINGNKNDVKINSSNSDKLNQQFIIQTADKNKTIFYDRVPYGQFDKIINADTEEPCIQIMYSLQVSYTMMTEENYQKNKEQIELQKKLQTQQLNAQLEGRKGRRNKMR
jgi:uncharacterized protein YggE